MSLPVSEKVEIQWDGVSWTDVSTYIDHQRSHPEARFGRMSPTGEVEPAEFTVTLDNRDGRFTPGNPAGAYWPNVKNGVSIRWKVTGGDAVERTEFVGYIQGYEPDWVDGGVSGAVVTVTAADRFAIANRTLADQAIEQARYDSAQASKVFDAWPLTDRPGSQTLQNVGTAVTGSAGQGAIYWPGKDPNNGALDGGSATLSVPDAGLLASGSLSLEPISEVGPVVVLPVSCPTVGSIQFWMRTTEIPLANMTLAQGFDASGEPLWKLTLNPSGSSVNIGSYNAAGTLLREFGGGMNDGEWRHIWLEGSSSGQAGPWFVNWTEAKRNVYYSLWITGAGGNITIDDTKTIVIGGQVYPTRVGRQTLCPTVEVAQIIVTEKTMQTESFGYGKRGVATYSRDALSDWVGDVSGYGFGDTAAVTLSATADPVLCPPDLPGQSVTQVLQELARTVGGVAWSTPAGTVQFLGADNLRPGTPDLTIDAEADAEGTFTLVASTSTRPTRVSVTSPVGDVQAVSTTEGTAQVEESIDTCASTLDQARYAGELLMLGTDVLRVSQISVNLSTATADLWSDAYGLYPHARVRVSGLPSDVMGVTYADYWCAGWTKRAIAGTDGAEDGFVVELDLEPAWTIGEVESARAGAATGAMTATVGSISGTSTGTLVVTTGSGPALSNDASDYPRDFDWNGERVTVTSAPASASSPQTLTVTARGVAPSVARTHGAGEAFNVWTPGKVGI